jgi:hypothetical protein
MCRHISTEQAPDLAMQASVGQLHSNAVLTQHCVTNTKADKWSLSANCVGVVGRKQVPQPQRYLPHNWQGPSLQDQWVRDCLLS